MTGVNSEVWSKGIRSTREGLLGSFRLELRFEETESQEWRFCEGGHLIMSLKDDTDFNGQNAERVFQNFSLV